MFSYKYWSYIYHLKHLQLLTFQIIKLKQLLQSAQVEVKVNFIYCNC